MDVTVIDLDGSLTPQPVLREAVGSGRARLVRARDLAPGLRILSRRAALAALSARLGPSPGGAPLIFYGSGDFHHLCALFLEPLREPYILLHFDQHPDWTTFPRTLNCGAWVNRVLERPALERVVTIGASGPDFVRAQWKFANIAALRAGRLEVHPWRGAPSRVLGGGFAAAGCRTEGRGPLRRLVWHDLADADWDGFAAGLDRRLPLLPLWVTIDKDVLPPEEAVTNWDQGGLRLDAVMGLVARLAARRRVLGIDVCGDYSPPVFHDPLRALISATDRPRPRPDGRSACPVNNHTNARILALAESLLA